MTVQEAKQILLEYRGSAAAQENPAMGEALTLARQDRELGVWFEQHCAVQEAIRAKLREIAPPAGLKEQLLAGPRVIQPKAFWQNPAWLAAAAAIVLLLGFASFFLGSRPPDSFADYSARMVRTVLREYRMDIVTNDMSQVRQFLAARGAPADYKLTTGLEKLSLTGAGLLRWRGTPVSMICFNRGDNQMVFLFVLNRTALRDPPPSDPQSAKVNKLLTTGWSEGNRIYLLAGPDEAGSLKKYL